MSKIPATPAPEQPNQVTKPLYIASVYDPKNLLGDLNPSESIIDIYGTPLTAANVREAIKAALNKLIEPYITELPELSKEKTVIFPDSPHDGC